MFVSSYIQFLPLVCALLLVGCGGTKPPIAPARPDDVRLTLDQTNTRVDWVATKRIVGKTVQVEGGWDDRGSISGVALLAADGAVRQLTATIEEGWHLYSLKQLEGGPIATQIAVPPPQQFKLAGMIDAPVPLTAHEEAFDMSVEFYFGEVEFILPIEVNRDAKPGPHNLAVTARYQACDNKQCLPPKTVRLESPVTLK